MYDKHQLADEIAKSADALDSLAEILNGALGMAEMIKADLPHIEMPTGGFLFLTHSIKQSITRAKDLSHKISNRAVELRQEGLNDE